MAIIDGVKVKLFSLSANPELAEELETKIKEAINAKE